MNWSNPESRLALLEQIGPDEYNRRFADYRQNTTVAIVRGHAISPIGTQFGKLWRVGDTGRAFASLPQAKAYAIANPYDYTI